MAGWTNGMSGGTRVIGVELGRLVLLKQGYWTKGMLGVLQLGVRATRARKVKLIGSTSARVLD